MQVALFQFATNAVGKVPAIIENAVSLYLVNALERAAGVRVIDLSPPPREGEVLSLTRVLEAEEVREVAERVGADACIWGALRFTPEGKPLIEGLEITIMAARVEAEAPVGCRSFDLDALHGDVRTGDLSLEVPVLEAVVADVLDAVVDILGLERGHMEPDRIGEGLSVSDRALAHFACALRIAAEPQVKLQLYLKAIAADPGFELAYTNTAQLLIGEGRHGEAVRLLLRARNRLKGSELEADILNLLGVATLHMGMWDEALRVWGDALEVRPDYVEVLCNLASAHAMREMPDEAEEYYRRALSFRESYPLAWFSLGRMQAKEGRYGEAEASMRRYIELCPGDPWAYYILGTSLAGLGQESEAEFALAKAMRLDPDGEAGALASQELRRLKNE